MKIAQTSPALLAALMLLALGGLAVGCGDEDDDSPAGNATDVAFIADMTAHHQGAIEMAQLAHTRAEHRRVRLLADAIVEAQKGEIATMRRMRQDMGMHDDGHMGMSAREMGMDMDMSALEHARPFDRAFIDAMIPHHQGAIAMAKQLLAKGEQPALRRMAEDMIAAQGGEIAQMRMWRKQWYGSAPDSMTADDDMSGHKME